MFRIFIAAALLGAVPAASAVAHAVAGARLFPVTLTIDDPGVADEASLPTGSFQRFGATSDSGATYQTNISAEFDKRITDRLGIGVNYGFSHVDTKGDKTLDGFQDLLVTLKYQAYVNPEHEFIVSAGVIREFGGTGTARIGADSYGYTLPTLYFGKGLGDLPIGLLRPLAVTGTLGYSIADKKLKGSASIDPLTGLAGTLFNNGFENRIVGGLSLQYSLPYLQQQVRDIGLPDFFGRLTPLVELAWSSPASRPHAVPVQLVYAPGIIYSGDTYQFGIEALIPGNKASGRNVGVIAQMHLFFDDLFPKSLGKPLFSGGGI